MTSTTTSENTNVETAYDVATVSPSTADTVAIGDVHGRADLLEALLETVAGDAGGRRVVFLGDIVDRGPDSRLALKLVADELDTTPDSVLILGNHEELMLSFLDGERKAAPFHAWMHNGGVATVRSFGIDPNLDPYRIAEILSGASEVQVLRRGIDMVRSDKFAFVHAGVRPDVSLERQSLFDLRWIREPFLGYSGSLEKMVVHGHTPTSSGLPELRRNRVNLDTGAFATDRLSAIHIAADETAFGFLAAVGATNEAVQVQDCMPTMG